MARGRIFTVGDSLLNKKGEKFTIKEWINSKTVYVEFDNGEIVKTTSSAIHTRSILNDKSPTLFGVGIITGGFIDGLRDSKSREYHIWADMLRRVYVKSEKVHKYYSDCTVCDEWLYFKNFSEWIVALPQWKYDGWQLDKDISCGRIYSPETCFLVPASINALLKRSKVTDLPRGVRKIGNRYQARFGAWGLKGDQIFDNLEEARNFYIHGMRQLLDSRIEEYKDRLDPKCIELLLNFNVGDL